MAEYGAICSSVAPWRNISVAAQCRSTCAPRNGASIPARACTRYDRGNGTDLEWFPRGQHADEQTAVLNGRTPPSTILQDGIAHLLRDRILLRNGIYLTRGHWHASNQYRRGPFVMSPARTRAVPRAEPQHGPLVQRGSHCPGGNDAFDMGCRQVSRQCGEPPHREARHRVVQPRPALTLSNQVTQEHPHYRTTPLAFDRLRPGSG